MSVEVIKPKDMVISVPHSGTRSLVDHLGLKSHTHFGQKSAKNLGAAERFHVPIRNPVDVAKAWARRGKPVDGLLESYELMFQFLSWSKRHTLYRMEDFPNTKGSGDVGKTSESATEAYQSRVMRTVVEPHMEFFAGFYDGLG